MIVDMGGSKENGRPDQGRPCGGTRLWFHRTRLAAGRRGPISSWLEGIEMRALFGAGLVAVALAGCVSTVATQKTVGARWIGQSLDSFVVANGPPSAPYTMADGRRIVEWQESFGVAGAGPLVVAASGASTEAGSLKLNCKLRLTVSKAGIIEDIVVANDTIGAWTLSRCQEALKG